MDLLEEVRDYPGMRGGDAAGPADADNGMIAIPFRLATIDGVLSFFSTTTVFETPVDITVSELAIEAFLPADAQTAEIMRRLGQTSVASPGDIRSETGLAGTGAVVAA